MKVGDRVVVTVTEHEGLSGEVIGFTENCVRIKPDNPVWGEWVAFLKEYVTLEERAEKTSRLEKIRVRNIKQARRLRDSGRSILGIAMTMGAKESTVRSWLKSDNGTAN